MSLDERWFTEACESCGSAFSLSVRKKLHEEQSEFQKIEIYETEKFGNLMVIDGFYMVTDRDNFLYHEMISHPALYQHAAPRKVVVIGGGDCGTMKEVLKHPEVEEAWQVEIDERVTRLSEQYFPSLCESNNDPRANFFFGDGIQWIKDAAPESIDVIIIDSTDPIGPAEGLFTEPFYRDCIKALRNGGILVQQSESPLYHTQHIIIPLHKAMRKSGFQTTKTFHFPQCIYPSGWWTVTMAQKNGDLSSIREADANNRPFDTEYYNLEIHKGASAQPEFLRKALEEI